MYSDLNSERLPPYHRLDFALTKHLNWSRVNQAEVGLSIFNIYNRINQRDVRYFYSENEGGEATLQAYNIDMLGVVPSLKIKINF